MCASCAYINKYLCILVGVIIGIVNHQVIAAMETGQGECATTLNPLIIQVEFDGTNRYIDTGTVKTKYLEELNEYIREMSGNRVCVKGEVTEKWYKLGEIKNYWVPWQNLQAVSYKLRNLVQESLEAADRDVDVSKYDFVILALGANFRQWGNHGLTAYPGMLGWQSDDVLMTTSGHKVRNGIAVFAYSVELGHIFHDVAHILGGVKDGHRVLPCLYDQDMESSSTSKEPSSVFEAFTNSQINMGGWDTMSCNRCAQRPAPPGISSWSRLRLGWMESSKVRVVNPGEKVQVTLGPLEDAAAETQVIRIPISATTYYLIENRQYIGHDRNLPEAGVLIMYADDTIHESRYGRAPVKLINADPSVRHLESAAFDIGKNDSFTDEQNGLKIKLIAKHDESYNILVERK